MKVGLTLKRLFRWPLPPLRLRHKLGFSLSVAALLPVLVASWVAVSVVFRSLNREIIDETDRQLQVGLNLMLRNVERLGVVAVRLSSSHELVVAMSSGPSAIRDALVAQNPNLPSSLVQVANSRGELVAQHIVGGGNERFESMAAQPSDSALEAGLAYERRITILAVGGQLIVRAAAPIVDASFSLLGAVVVSLPFDSEFADGLKGALGTDVLIFAAENGVPGPAMSTFLDPVGARVDGLLAPPGAVLAVTDGDTGFANQAILGREYTVGYTPLVNLAGDKIGVFAVAVDRAPLLSARSAATRSLALGAAGAFVFAIGLAGLLSRRITRPIARLHEGAIAIARGDLDHNIEVGDGDEIGDLAEAFSNMTGALKLNEARLAARMREIVALHDAGRAVSSVIDPDQVLRAVVDQVSQVFSFRICALWLTDPGGGRLRLGAARAKDRDSSATVSEAVSRAMAKPLVDVAETVIAEHAVIRLDRLYDELRFRGASAAAGIKGSLLAIPLSGKNEVVGAIVVARDGEASPFSDADANLLATFAGQASTAIENAGLYKEVRQFNEELEAKVRQRTLALVEMNEELNRTITELSETQAQLVLSERLAGLGQLVAGVAHEINSPAAAIAGSVDALADTVQRLTNAARRVAALELGAAEWQAFVALAKEAAADLGNRPVPSPVLVRRTARELSGRLREAGVNQETADQVSRSLAELIPEPELLSRLSALVVTGRADAIDVRARTLVAYLREYVYLHRSANMIHTAIRRIQRIVGGLKSYSHLDQEARLESNIHDGIENTLVILEHLLGQGGIQVSRKYGDLPPVHVFVDELNQVWTNLLHNAIQALKGRGRITIESARIGDEVVVRIIDDGPGISPESMDRIFEPFYTTKPKGEGTGLGLRIVKQIVEKHHGSVAATSRAGETCFEVRLPMVAADESGAEESAADESGADESGAEESAPTARNDSRGAGA